MDNKLEKTIIVAALCFTVLAGLVFIYLNTSTTPITRSPAQNQTNQPEPKETTLFFAGDIMLSRDVHTRIIQANNVNFPYLKTSEVINNADIAFANLESPFSNKPRISDNDLEFKADPNNVQGLINAGFDIISTANNHAFDQGREAVTYTYNWLKENNLTPVGTELDCHEGATKEVNGLKFGFLAYSYAAFNDGGAVPDTLVCDWNNQNQVLQDIRTLKPHVDFLVISAHFGEEYVRKPASKDAESARAIIDAGADVFIGHHPHWIQTIEEYKGKYIFYSLGNFVFDQMWSVDTQQGLTLKVTLKDTVIDTIELQPVLIENYCCPRWANTEETKNILTKINPNYINNILVKDGKTASDWIDAVSQRHQTQTP